MSLVRLPARLRVVRFPEPAPATTLGELIADLQTIGDRLEVAIAQCGQVQSFGSSASYCLADARVQVAKVATELVQIKHRTPRG